MSYTVVLYCFTFVTNLIIIIIIIINCKVYLLVTDLERGVFLKKLPRGMNISFQGVMFLWNTTIERSITNILYRKFNFGLIFVA